MTRFVFIYIGVVLAAFSSCNDKKMASQLDAISKIADTNPDSALVVLSALEQNKEDWAKNDQIYYELVKMKAENKADVQFTSDSIIKDVVKYYKGRDSNDLMLTISSIKVENDIIDTIRQGVETSKSGSSKEDIENRWKNKIIENIPCFCYYIKRTRDEWNHMGQKYVSYSSMPLFYGKEGREGVCRIITKDCK